MLCKIIPCYRRNKTIQEGAEINDLNFKWAYLVQLVQYSTFCCKTDSDKVEDGETCKGISDYGGQLKWLFVYS